MEFLSPALEGKSPFTRNNSSGNPKCMTLSPKVRKIGNSLGVVLPKEVLSHLHVEEGEALTLTEAQDGVRLTAADLSFTETMEVFESLSRRYRNAQRELAK